MKNIKLFLLIIILFCCITFWNSCEQGDSKLIIVNNSNDTVFFITTGERKFQYSPIQYSEDGNIEWRYTNYLVPHSNQVTSILGQWESSVNDGKDSSLYVFFFKKNLIYNTPKDSLIKYQKYTIMYKYKITDLQKLNWRVVYR